MTIASRELIAHYVERIPYVRREEEGRSAHVKSRERAHRRSADRSAASSSRSAPRSDDREPPAGSASSASASVKAPVPAPSCPRPPGVTPHDSRTYPRGPQSCGESACAPRPWRGPSSLGRRLEHDAFRPESPLREPGVGQRHRRTREEPRRAGCAAAVKPSPPVATRPYRVKRMTMHSGRILHVRSRRRGRHRRSAARTFPRRVRVLFDRPRAHQHGNTLTDFAIVSSRHTRTRSTRGRPRAPHPPVLASIRVVPGDGFDLARGECPGANPSCSTEVSRR